MYVCMYKHTFLKVERSDSIKFGSWEQTNGLTNSDYLSTILICRSCMTTGTQKTLALRYIENRHFHSGSYLGNRYYQSATQKTGTTQSSGTQNTGTLSGTYIGSMHFYLGTQKKMHFYRGRYILSKRALALRQVQLSHKRQFVCTYAVNVNTVRPFVLSVSVGKRH